MATSFQERLNQIRSGSTGGTNSSFQERLNQIRSGSTSPTINSAPPMASSWFEEMFKPEIGFVQNVMGRFNIKNAIDLTIRDAQETTQLTNMMLKATGTKKQQLANVLKQRLSTQPDYIGTLVPQYNKTFSQQFGEAFSFGLLALPTAEIKGLSKLPWVTRFIEGGVMGGIYGGALGLSEEGALKEKAPTIAIMMGLGAVGTGIATAILPPLLGATGKAIKGTWDKLYNSKPISKVVAPTVRFIERKVGKTTTEKVIGTTGVRGIDTEISKLTEKISKLQGAADNMALNVPVLSPSTGRKIGSELTTSGTLIKQRDRLSNVQKKIATLEKQRNNLLGQRVEDSLIEGDVIFNKELGRVKVSQFYLDENGKVMTLGQDINGRMVMLQPQDMLSMKKINPQTTQVVREIVGLPDIPNNPVIMATKDRLKNGLRLFLQSGGPMLDSLGSSGKALRVVLNNAIDEIPKRMGKANLSIDRFIRKYNLTKVPFTAEETRNIVDILDAGLKIKAVNPGDIPIKPISQRVADFVDTFSKITKDMVGESSSRRIFVRDRTTGERYLIGEPYVHFPHILKDPEKLKSQLPHLVELQAKRRDISPQKANLIINGFLKNRAVNRYAGLEQRRTLLIEGFDELERFGYETNPIQALKEFTAGASRRLAEANNFGPENEVIVRLIDDINASGYDSGLAREVIDAYNGYRGVSASWKETTELIRNVQTVAKLPLSFITNATQTVNTMTEFGFARTVKLFGRFMRNSLPAKEFATLAGVSDDMINRAMSAAGLDTEFARTALRKNFFTPVEQFNRTMASNTGADWAKWALKKLIQSPNNPKLLRHLTQLGVDANKAIARGNWTPEELLTIGRGAISNTQFRGSVLDIPVKWMTPGGKVLTQFKSFAWQQGAFVKNVIIDELLQGNLHPLITFLVISQITGEGLKDVRTVLRGDLTLSTRPSMDNLERYIQNQLSVAGFGLAGDLFYNMYQRAKGKYYITAIDMATGPTLGELGDIIDGISDAMGGNFDPLIKLGGRDAALLSLFPKIKDVPGAGPVLRVVGDILANIATSDK